MKSLLAVGAIISIPFVTAGAVFDDSSGALLGAMTAVASLLVAWFLSPRVVLLLCRARMIEPDEAPHLIEAVERLACKAGIRPPRIAVSAMRSPNAFAAATPRGGIVGVTSGLLRLLSPPELEAVLAHEVAHLSRRGRAAATIAAVFAAAPGSMSVASGGDLFFDARYRRPLVRAWGGRRLRPLRDAIAIASVPLTALLVRVSVSREDEFQADAGAAMLNGANDSIVTALRKIDALAGRIAVPVNPAVSHMLVIHPFGDQRVSRMFNTHPPVTERLAALVAGRTCRERP